MSDLRSELKAILSEEFLAGTRVTSGRSLATPRKRKPKFRQEQLSTTHLIRCFRAWKDALKPYREMPDYARKYYAGELLRRFGLQRKEAER